MHSDSGANGPALKRGSGRAGAHASVCVRGGLTKGSSHSSCQPTYRRPLSFVDGRRFSAKLGHSNLGITSVDLQGIDNAEIIDARSPRR